MFVGKWGNGMHKHILLMLILAFAFVSIVHSQTVNNSFFSCFNVPSNPSKADIFLLINLTKSENTYGACALAALSSYKSSNTLSQYNISINLTKLNTQFFNGNPVLPSSEDSKKIVSNSTFLNVSTPGQMCIKYTPESNNSSSNSQRVHIHKCTPGQIKTADIVVNVTTPNTEIMVLPPPPTNIIASNSPISFTVDNTFVNSDPPSYNWVGYQEGVSLQTIREVSGSWIVQNALSSESDRFSSQWIGISDYVGTEMMQIETLSCFQNYLISPCFNPLGPGYGAQLQYVDAYGHVHTINQSAFNFTVEAGDKISAHITIINSSSTSNLESFEAQICDSRGSSHVCSPLITGIENISNLYAEWIDERPAVPLTFSRFSNFTNFVNASFGVASTGVLDNVSTINGYSEGINPSYSQIYSMINSGDLGDSANVTNLFNGSSFIVRNFRVGYLVASQQTVNQGQPYNISLVTDNDNSALGGTGSYTYQWFEDKGTGYSSSSDCNFPVLYPEGPNCAINSAQPGTYSFKLLVKPVGGPFTEAVNSTPITVTVKPSTLSSTPIAITNYQSSATPAPFQQMLVIDSAAFSGINSNWNNVEFTTGSYATGMLLQAWVESNASSSSTHTIVWVNLPYGISGYGSTTIYMNVMPTPIMSSAGPTGEAPQLSPTYAEYDNGASVFNFYDNFKGTSLSGSWTHTTNAAISVNNGLGITFSGLDAYIVTNSHYGVGTAFDSDITYFEDNSSLAANSTNETDPDDMGYININQPQSAIGNSGWSATMIRAACNNLYPTQINPSGEANSCGNVFGAFAYGHIPIGIYTVNPITSSSSLQYVGYSTSGTRQPIAGDAPYYPASVGYAQMSYGPFTNRITAQWVRVRNAPPNGVMPIATDPNLSIR